MRTRTIALTALISIFAVGVHWFLSGTVHMRTMQGDPVNWWAFDLKTQNLEQQNFDFIVVGAGVAGSVIASRLNKNGFRVLVLERGESDVHGEELFDMVSAPSQFTKNINDPRFSWNIESTEQSALNGRKVFLPQGSNASKLRIKRFKAKIYGGSGSVAPLLVHLPSKQHFEDWKVKGWEYDQFEKMFPVILANYSTPLPELHNSTLEIINSAKSLGYNLFDQTKTKEQEGFGVAHVMHHGGRRWTTADSHLKLAIRFANRKGKDLKHVIGAHVTKILFNENKVATGVEFVEVESGKKFTAHASKEVIICAGAINTPQLLMLSGIGPKEQLTSKGIQVLSDLPVGKNLQEQIAIPVIFESKLPSLQTEGTLANEIRWILFGEGPLASTVFEGVGYLKSQPSLTHPDIELIIAPAFYQHHQSNFDRDALTILVTVPQPHSHGTVELQSADPFAAPRVNPNFLSDKRDLQTLFKGFEVARKLGQSTKSAVGEELIPGSKVQGETGFQKYVQEQLMGLFFPVGTCRMGSDANAVVDENLFVKGVQNLRVVDGSILPSQPAGSAYVTLVAVAEKAALVILQQHK